MDFAFGERGWRTRQRVPRRLPSVGGVPRWLLLVGVLLPTVVWADPVPPYPDIRIRIAPDIDLPATPSLEFDFDVDTPDQVLGILVQHPGEMDRAEVEKSDLLFVFGYCLWSVGQIDAAIAPLEHYLDGGGVLRPYAEWVLGAIYLERGRHDAARRYLTRAMADEPAGPAHDLAALGLAARLREQGKLPQAVKAFEEVAHQAKLVGVAVQAWLEQARTLEKMGREEEAMSAYVHLWAVGAGRSQAEEAYASFQRLARKHGVAADAESRYKHALRLMKLGRVREAAEELDVLARDDRARKALPRIDVVTADAWFRAKEYDKALAYYSRAAATVRDDKRAELLYRLARTRGRLGDIEGAIQGYTRLAETYHDDLGDRALATIGLLRLDQGRYADAENAFQAVLARSPVDRVLRHVLPQLAWCLLRQGKYDDAEAVYERLQGDRIGVSYAAYWRGRIAMARGDTEEAVAAWLDAAAPREPSVYAVLARIMLKGLGVALPEPDPATDDELTPRLPWAGNPVAVERADALYRLGLRQWAGAEIRNALPGGRWRDEARLGFARWLEARGEFAWALRTVHRVRRAPSNGYPRMGDRDWVWRLSYPRAFRDQLAGFERPEQVPENLVYAVMRQESLFDRWAVSPAGARGPMQLMPDTAADVARQLGIPAPSARALHDPATAVTLGTWLLASLLDRYDGNLPLALAAYNAGEEAVDRWLEERPGLPIDMFMEEISYAETRNYVKKVLTNLWVCCRLYGNGVDDFADGIPLVPTAPLPAASPGTEDVEEAGISASGEGASEGVPARSEAHEGAGKADSRQPRGPNGAPGTGEGGR